MKITIWNNFSKRKNSTLQPTGGTELDVTLKTPTSIETPTFLLTSSDPTISYVKAWDRYYFVTDLIFVTANTIELKCDVDVLATYKSDISSTSAYVIYDTTTNIQIPDTRLATKTTPGYAASGKLLRSDISSAGTCIVSLTGVDKVGTYVIPQGNLSKLVPDITTVFDTFIQGTTPWESYRDSMKQLVGSGSVAENIKDVRWIPFAVTGDTVVSPLKVGMYEITGVGGRLINNRIDVETVDVSIPWQYPLGDWRNTDPYTQVHVYIPFVGVVTFPASQIKDVDSLTFTVSLDRYTGDLAITVGAGSVILGTYGASTGVAIAIGGSTVNPGRIASAVIGGVSAVASGSVGGLVSAIVSGATPISQSVGGISSGASSKLYNNIQIVVITHEPVVTPSSVSSVMGTPAYEVKTLGNLSGYIQCSDASVNLNGSETDKEAVNGYLNGGFYFE